MNKLNVAVLGYGSWGQNLARNFSQLGALRLVCDPAEGARIKAREIATGAEIVGDFEAVFRRSDIYGVALATPAETHAPLAELALASGKDVLVEKPMTLSVAEAANLVEAAERNGRILMVGHLLLYSPAIAWIKQHIESGELGKIHHISVKRAKQGKVRTHENVMWSFACHDIAAVLYLLGENNPVDIRAVGNCFLQQSIEDDTHLHLKFAGGASVHIHSSWYWPDNERHFVILGDKQWVKYDEVAGTITVYRKGITAELHNRDDGSFQAEFESAQPLLQECQHFLDCIISRAEPRSGGRSGLAVVSILEKATRLIKIN